jgi:hypothetical protein
MGGTPRGGRWLGRNPRHMRPCCLGWQEAWLMGCAYLTQEEVQRIIEPNTLTAPLPCSHNSATANVETGPKLIKHQGGETICEHVGEL